LQDIGVTIEQARAMSGAHQTNPALQAAIPTTEHSATHQLYWASQSKEIIVERQVSRW